MANPFKYTDRTYNTILNTLNTTEGLADKPEWFKRYLAGLGDTFSVIIDAIANDSLLPTALTRESTQALLKLIDYELGTPTTSSGINIFNAKDTTPNGTIFTQADLKAATSGSLAVSAKKFESRTSYTYNKQIADFTRADSTQFTTAFDFEYTGIKVRLTTTGTLPAGLELDTDYYVIYVNSTTFKLATSIKNAFADVPVTTTDVGIGIHTTEIFGFGVELFQQETREERVIGTSDGITPFQEFILPDRNIITNTLVVTIGGDQYTEETTLIESGATDKVFRILTKSEGIIALQFGNNEFGLIPPPTDISAQYAVGGGILSNISVLNSINVYSGTNSEIDSTTNATIYTGGSDEESIENAKIRAPILLKARNRFVTTEDGEVLTLALGGLSYVKIVRNAFGALTCEVFAVATGGGNPSTSKKTEIETELTEKTILESVTVVVSDLTFIAPATIANIKILSGYTFSEIETRANLGLKLFYTETAREIKQKYLEDGITETIELINNLFGTSFSNGDNSWITPLVENLNPVSVGDTINNSDIVSYIKANIEGIDDITFSAPSFPINLNDDELTTHNGISITINEV